MIKKYKKEEYLLMLIVLATIFSLAFLYLISVPISGIPDARNYLHMAQWEVDDHPVRRYRVIIPFLAGGLDQCAGWAFDKLHPWSFEGDFSMALCFLLINTGLMTAAYVMIFFMLRKMKYSYLISIIGILAGLSCRWTIEVSALPLVDAFYFLCAVLFFYGVRMASMPALIISMYAGMWAKESFVLFLPLLLFVSHQWKKWVWHGILGMLVYVGFRIVYDILTEYNSMKSISEDLSHVQNIMGSLTRLFSVHGMYEVFSVIGFWIIIPMWIGWKRKKIFCPPENQHSKFYLSFLFVVFVHALLSQDLGRMLYLAMPLYILWLAESLQQMKIDSSEPYTSRS